MKKKIYKYLDNIEKYAPIIAKEIVETFVTEANDENVDYSFTVNGATGNIYSEEAEPNTYFVFDTKEEMVLDGFKKSLFDEDLSGLEEHSKEEEVLMEDVRNFLLKVCGTMESEYHEQIRETVRRVVLGNKVDEKRVPLSLINVTSIDIADYTSIPESSRYLLKIGKVPGSDINTDEVIKLIQDRQEKTGMDIDTVFSIEKKSGNPIMKNVEAIILGRKFLNEISIYFFVDYSAISEEELVEENIEEKPVDSEK
jgi:putative lipoic acid-binding regulatory protein